MVDLFSKRANNVYVTPSRRVHVALRRSGTAARPAAARARPARRGAARRRGAGPRRPRPPRPSPRPSPRSSPSRRATPWRTSRWTRSPTTSRPSRTTTSYAVRIPVRLLPPTPIHARFQTRIRIITHKILKFRIFFRSVIS